ncbi:hypothetical protein AAFC00_002687 [Neodothiora populina]|uniref:Uncharacterized protein n=1 Tax=Neodothiora populina TaxID=2781224 RepID=A0ABR3P869_9PEZI
MYRRNDPRFRRTLNEISQTIESANETAQANVYTFSHRYLTPCFSSIGDCFGPCTASCCAPRDQRRRSRARSRGRAELSFDFYDDWDDEEDTSLLGWGNDEYDSLLGSSRGYGATTTQPARQRGMSYGTSRRGNRRRSQPRESADPTVIPAASYWGLFGKLTGKLGAGKSLRYKPSAADLQEHPGAAHHTPENAPLLEEDEEDEVRQAFNSRGHKRVRSGTQGSGNTTDSLSSRGDIFPSEDELDDAIPLDDEFAMVLERRTTNSGMDEASSGRKGKRPSAGSRMSTRTLSSRSSRNSKRLSRCNSTESPAKDVSTEPKIIASMAELKQEEDEAQEEEEAEIVKRRVAAHRLAAERLADVPGDSIPSVEKAVVPLGETPDGEPTTPFPPFDPQAMNDPDTIDENEIASLGLEPGADDEGQFNAARLPRLPGDNSM